MGSLKETANRINSIRDTLKITNAMYLISSSKLQKARKNLADVTGYFKTMQNTIADILIHMPELENQYFDDGKTVTKTHKRKACIVVTADKGLVGAYNSNVLKLAEEQLVKHKDARLFVIGEVGRHHFIGKSIRLQEDFLYSSQNPSLERARSITAELLKLYLAGVIDEVSIIFTNMKNALQSETKLLQLLPLKKQNFKAASIRAKVSDQQEEYLQIEGFFPSEESVMNQVAPIYMQGIIFGALTESYCAELSDRMNAMDAATKNGRDMIAELKLIYNRNRQGAITQEITEVIGGSRAQKLKI